MISRRHAAGEHSSYCAALLVASTLIVTGLVLLLVVDVAGANIGAGLVMLAGHAAALATLLTSTAPGSHVAPALVALGLLLVLIPLPLTASIALPMSGVLSLAGCAIGWRALRREIPR